MAVLQGFNAHVRVYLDKLFQYKSIWEFIP